MGASRIVTNGPGELAEALQTAAADASNDELLRACRRLENERSRYHELFASSRDACVVTDDKGVIVDANRRAADLLGMPAGALHRKLLIAFVARGDTRLFRKCLASVEECARSGDPVRVRLRSRGGSPFEAVLWVDVGWRSSSDDPVSYRWTIHVAQRRSADESGLHEVLGAVARLAQSLPAEVGQRAPAEAAERAPDEHAPDEHGARVGDSVVRAIHGLSAAAEQRRVRFVVAGGEEPDYVDALAPRLDESIGALLQGALRATRDGAELHIRLGRHEGETVLDVHVDGVEAHSMGSPLSLVLLATRLAADGGRLEVKGGDGQPLIRVRWSCSRGSPRAARV